MTHQPLVAIVGSARADITGNKESDARKACTNLGEALAKQNLRIAVYSDHPDFIECDVVQGYVRSGEAKPRSILWYYPQGEASDFKGLETHPELLDPHPDPSSDWEVSFYRSLVKVDAVLLLGGGPSTLIAGHVALSISLPVLAIADFGGEANKIWRHLSSKPALIEEQDLRAMARWTSESPMACVASLRGQLDRAVMIKKEKDNELKELQEKAKQLAALRLSIASDSTKLRRSLVFLITFIALLITGVSLPRTGMTYTIIFVVGLCTAGGLGATVRMLTPNAPQSRRWVDAVLGVVVGLVLSLLYLIPQLIGDAGFLVGGKVIEDAAKVQFISALIVAFLAGIGFDFALDQLLRRSRDQSSDLVDTFASYSKVDK